jgi:hypothetical protein
MSEAIRAELTKSNIAAAEGITVKAQSPVLGLCRRLIAAGHDPATPLNVYRGKTLALRILGIGEARGLEIAGDGVGFRQVRRPDAPRPCVIAARLRNDRAPPQLCPALQLILRAFHLAKHMVVARTAPQEHEAAAAVFASAAST